MAFLRQHGRDMTVAVGECPQMRFRMHVVLSRRSIDGTYGHGQTAPAIDYPFHFT